MAKLNRIELKLIWTHKQLQNFATEVNAALHEHGESVRLEFKADTDISKPPGVTDTRRWDSVTMYVGNAGTLNPEIGLRLGEVVHHFRGGLDHLAWQLVPSTLRRQLHVRGRRNIQFPLAESHRNFTQQIGRRLPGVSPHHIAIIERFQPYHRSVAGKTMRLLRNLSDIDKHRIIVLPVVLPHHADFEFILQGAAFIERESLIEQVTKIKKGSELARFIVAVDEGNSGFHVQVKGAATNELALPKSLIRPFAGVDIILVRDALEEIALQCADLFGQISDNP